MVILCDMRKVHEIQISVSEIKFYLEHSHLRLALHFFKASVVLQ